MSSDPDDRTWSEGAGERYTRQAEPATVPLDPRGPVRRPSGPRRPLWTLAVLVALVVAAVALGRLTDLRLWPSLPNPFASRSVDRSQPVLLRSIQDLSVHKAATGNFEVLVDIEKDSPLVPSFLKGERTLFVAAGTVDAEVDFSRLDPSAVKVSEDRRSASITLPHARLAKPHIDPGRSYVANRERGALDRLGSVFSDNPTSERELYLLAEQRLAEAARQSELVAKAEQNTREMLQTMLRSLGYTEVTVTFEDPPS
jgi:Protein of unknown function (DUF4230)